MGPRLVKVVAFITASVFALMMAVGCDSGAPAGNDSMAKQLEQAKKDNGITTTDPKGRDDASKKKEVSKVPPPTTTTGG